MTPGALRHRITLQQMTDGASDWIDVAKVWADIRAVSAKEKIDRADAEQIITHRITIRHRSDVKSVMRVLYGGRLFGIESALDPDERRRWLVLECEELHSLIDTVTVKRKERVKDGRNVVTSTDLPPRDVQACIVDVQYGYEQQGNDPVNWEKKATVDFELGEDVREGDTITLSAHGDFFVTQARPGKHFLQVVAIQERRGAE